MRFHMLRMTNEILKVLKTIICLIMVNVMNNLRFLEDSTKMLFHNITVFCNIPISVCIWMVFYHNPNITTLTNYATTSPSWCFLTNKNTASPFTMTFSRTSYSGLGIWISKCLSTCKTFGGFSSTSPICSILSGFISRAKYAHALSSTSSIGMILYSRWLSFKENITNRTFKSFISYHKTRLA